METIQTTNVSTNRTLLFPSLTSPPSNLPSSNSSIFSHPSAGEILRPCAACRTLRRRCDDNCILAPYFPQTDPMRFTNTRKVFGTSNIIKFLQEVPDSQRADAARSLIYEANARILDPVFGCAGEISQLQAQVSQLQTQLYQHQAELANTKAELAYMHSVQAIWQGTGIGGGVRGAAAAVTTNISSQQGQMLYDNNGPV